MSKFPEYIPIYDGDRYCLMCRHACPVGRVTKKESMTPHGWALLIASVNRGLLRWNAESVDVLYHCADCGRCQANCATDRPLPYALVAAREEVVRLGHAPESVKGLDDKLRAWGNPYREEVTEDGRPFVPQGKLPTNDDPSNIERQTSNVTGPTSNVVVFVGDDTYFLRPSAIHAAESLIHSLGANPVLFQVGRSSGYLPYTLGLWETARALAQETAQGLADRGAPLVVTLTTHDAHTLKNVYPELGVALPTTAYVTTLVDYLARAGNRLKIVPREPQNYTYHDPAQSVRLKGHFLAARVLATEVMGAEPREMLMRENLATPPGTTGGHAFTQPALAARLAQTRIQEARETGADILLTDDPLDTAILAQHADGIHVENLFEVLAERLADGE